jgi:hypothetical protein
MGLPVQSRIHPHFSVCGDAYSTILKKTTFPNDESLENFQKSLAGQVSSHLMMITKESSV